MSLGHVPVTLPRGLILIEAQVKAFWDLLHRFREAEIGRRGEHRIAAENKQRLDPILIHVPDKLAQGCGVVFRANLDRPRVNYRLPHVSKSLVDGVGEEMNGRGLTRSGQDNASAAVPLQIASDGGGPALEIWVL